jgi:hypothetical protein
MYKKRVAFKLLQTPVHPSLKDERSCG